MKRITTYVLLAFLMMGLMSMTSCDSGNVDWDLIQDAAVTYIMDLAIDAAHRYSDVEYKEKAVKWIEDRIEGIEWLQPYLKWVNIETMLGEIWDELWKTLMDVLPANGYDTDADDGDEPFGWYVDENDFPKVGAIIKSHVHG